MTAPERIWAWAWQTVPMGQWGITQSPSSVEYVRADLAAVQPAKVRVKPLVWSDRFGPNSECSYDHITADSALGLYRVEWKGWKDFDPPTVCCGGAFIGCYNTIQSAKSAAQADYEARILAALEPQPDPRVMGYDQAYQYALTLAGALMAKHYPDNKDWQPLGDLTGLLTQIDNMAAGKMPDPRDELIKRLVEALEWYDDPSSQGDVARAALAAAKAVQR